MKETPKNLYLELIKKNLVFSLWPEPLLPAETFNYKRPFIKRYIIKIASRILKAFQLHLGEKRIITERDKEEGYDFPISAVTMIGHKRLNNIQYCVQTALDDKIPGDLIEAGVWRGGACLFMKAILTSNNINNRKVFLADSFAGLPKPEADKYPADKGEEYYKEKFLAVSKEEVENNFRKFDLLDDNIIFLKGWFKDTLPTAPIEKLSVMRLDGDMYGSTMDSLENLYPKLSAGGFCIIDDYALEGCKKAVDDYRERNNIDSEIITIDWTGVYWRK